MVVTRSATKAARTQSVKTRRHFPTAPQHDRIILDIKGRIAELRRQGHVYPPAPPTPPKTASGAVKVETPSQVKVEGKRANKPTLAQLKAQLDYTSPEFEQRIVLARMRVWVLKGGNGDPGLAQLKARLASQAAEREKRQSDARIWAWFAGWTTKR